MRVFNNLFKREDIFIMKQDKGWGVVMMNKQNTLRNASHYCQQSHSKHSILTLQNRQNQKFKGC